LVCASPISLSFGWLAPRFYVSFTCAVWTVSVRDPLRTVTVTVTVSRPVLVSSARPVRLSVRVSVALRPADSLVLSEPTVTRWWRRIAVAVSLIGEQAAVPVHESRSESRWPVTVT